MAKITLISPRLHKQVHALAESLVYLKNEVTVVTHKNQEITEIPQYELLTYYTNDSVWESMKLFPRILMSNSDIWHFVFVNPSTDRIRFHMLALEAMVNLFPRKLVAITFFNSVRNYSEPSLKRLLRFAHLLTVSQREDLMYLKRKGLLNANTLTEVLPPLEWSSEKNSSVERNSEPHPDLQKMIKTLHPYLVFPRYKNFLSKKIPVVGFPTNLIRKNFSSIYLCERPSKKVHERDFFASSNLNRRDLEMVLKNSKALVLSPFQLSALELSSFFQICQNTKTPMVVSPQQLESFPGLVTPKKTGWVVDASQNSFQKVLDDNPNLQISKEFTSAQSYQLTDSIMNELNRLYIQALHRKTKELERRSSGLR